MIKNLSKRRRGSADSIHSLESKANNKKRKKRKNSGEDRFNTSKTKDEILKHERALSELKSLQKELEESKRLDAMTDRIRLQNELSRLDLALSKSEGSKTFKDYLTQRRVPSDIYGVKNSSSFELYQGHLEADHPARLFPPVDLLFLLDSSSSIGIVAFDQMKSNINKILEEVDIAPGRSRVSLIQFSHKPHVVFGFDKYYSFESIRRAIERTPYSGGSTFLAKALNFASGFLYHEQNLKEGTGMKHQTAPTPRHDRLQMLFVCSDGSSEDDVTTASAMLHENLQVKVGALVTRLTNKEKMVRVTRFEGAVFVMDEIESINIWIWRQQRLWMDNYASFLERQKQVLTERNDKKSTKTSRSKGKKQDVRPLSFL